MGFGNEMTALKSTTFEKPKCASNQLQTFFSMKTGSATGQPMQFQSVGDISDKKINWIFGFDYEITALKGTTFEKLKCESN